MRDPELTDNERSALQRLVEDEDLMGAVKAVCQINADEYKERTYRASVRIGSELHEITNEGYSARALESVETLILERYKKEFEEQQSNG